MQINKSTIWIGIITGIVASIFLINSSQKSHTVFGTGLVWQDLNGNTEILTWKSVFGNGAGQNLYAMAQNDLFSRPENSAYTAVGQNNGLTLDDTKAIISGDLRPILNNPNGPTYQTQEYAYKKMSAIQKEFTELKDIFYMENEIKLTTNADEIFADGDIQNSGFDLVHDLDTIEEILFEDVSSSTIGEPYTYELKFPFLSKKSKENNNQDTSTTPSYDYNIDETETTTASNYPPNNSNDIDDSSSDSIIIGDTEIIPETSESGVCVEDSDIQLALNDFENPTDNTPDTEGGDNNNSNDYSDSGINNSQFSPTDSFGNVDYTAPQKYKTDKYGYIKSAPADDWRMQFCTSTSTEADMKDMFGTTLFKSIGSDNPALQDVLKNAMENDSSLLSAKIAFCITLDYDMATAHSHTMSSSCILCEINKIVYLLDKTISHSLVPNKVTGNFLESAKCKDASELTSVDMKFIAIPAPIATGSDKTLFVKNPFEEWNSFVNMYRPVLLQNLTYDMAQNKLINTLPSDSTQGDLFTYIDKEVNTETAKNLVEMKNLKVSKYGMNINLYAKTLTGEIAQMTKFFKEYNQQFTKMYGVCTNVAKKQYID